MIELCDGIQYEGIVVVYECGGNIKFCMENGMILMFVEKEVQGVIYELLEEEIEKMECVVQCVVLELIMVIKEKLVYKFWEIGWFNNISFVFLFGCWEWEEVIFFSFLFEEEMVEMLVIGFNVQYIMGYQFNWMVGVGFGVSYDVYDLEDGELMVMVFGYYCVYLFKCIVVFFVVISVGYGFVLKNEEQGVKEIDGGLMFYLEIGLCLGVIDVVNFIILLGYCIQDVYYVQECLFNGNIEYWDVCYQCFLFIFGLLF